MIKMVTLITKYYFFLVANSHWLGKQVQSGHISLKMHVIGEFLYYNTYITTITSTLD